MSSKLNIEELKTLIANNIREENLHGALPDDAIERIKNKILAIRDRESGKEISNIVSEEIASPEHNLGNTFPEESQIESSPNQQVSMSGNSAPINYSSDIQVGQMVEPKMGYTPELPEMLKKAEPAELFVFQYNDIGASGENLSNKPMRLMDEPDVMTSMNDLWIQNGKTKAKIYLAKFEEMGEIEFNYADGTSKFIEKSSIPEYNGSSEYKENPYAEPSLPQIDSKTQGELETYIKSSIDLEGVVRDIVLGILKDSLKNNENIDSQFNSGDLNQIAPVIATNNMGEYIQEPNDFKLTIKEVIEGDSYEKVVLPAELNEEINSDKKSMLIAENENLQKWSFGGVEYYTLLGRISKDKGYIKC